MVFLIRCCFNTGPPSTTLADIKTTSDIRLLECVYLTQCNFNSFYGSLVDALGAYSRFNHWAFSIQVSHRCMYMCTIHRGDLSAVDTVSTAERLPLWIVHVYIHLCDTEGPVVLMLLSGPQST